MEHKEGIYTCGVHLVLGGQSQGKLACVSRQIGMEQSFSTGEIKVIDENCREDEPMADRQKVIVVNHLHLIVRQHLNRFFETADQMPADAAVELVTNAVIEKIEQLEERTEQLYVISNEIGNGIVPIEKEDRIWREALGRIVVTIAKRAVCVERVVCGIPQRLK